MADMVYLVAWKSDDQIVRGYYTRGRAEHEVERMAKAVAAANAAGIFGVFDDGLHIIELPLGGRVDLEEGLYLRHYLEAVP